MIRRIIFFAFMALCNICVAQKDSNSIDITTLYNCWADSREENLQGSTSFIYRPCDFKDFSPSRFRHRIEFKENGQCSSLKLAPDDAHYMVPGHWSYDKEQNIVTVKDVSGAIIFKSKLITLSKDLMKIEKIK